MKVLHVIPTIARSAGGPSEVVLQLTARLEALGTPCTVLTTDRDLKDDAPDLDRMLMARARPPRRFNLASGLRELLDQAIGEADVVHIHSVDSYPSSLAARRAVARGVAFVLQPHGAYDAYHRSQRRLIKSVYHRAVDARYFDEAAAVVVSSGREQDGVRQVLPDVPTVVVPLGVDPTVQLQAADQRVFHDPPTFLFLGRQTEKKQVDVAIRAFARSGMAHAGSRLVIAGPLDPRLKYDPRRLAEEEGVGTSIEFLGVVGSEARSKLLRGCDVFVLPSLDESFGMAVAEAMAAGCCVIATPEVGVIGDAANGGSVCAVAGTVKAFASTMAALGSDIAARRSMSRAAVEYARSNFDWLEIAREFQVIYEGLD